MYNMYVYIYIYIERERYRYMYIYTYTHMYNIHICTHSLTGSRQPGGCIGASWSASGSYRPEIDPLTPNMFLDVYLYWLELYRVRL